MALLAIFFCHAVLAAAVAVGGRSSSSTTTFNTTSGVFAPYFAASHPDVAAFPDIPYAQNPTGPLRFAPPVRARGDGDAVQLATSLPPGCFQYVPPFASGAVGDTAPGGFELRQGKLQHHQRGLPASVHLRATAGRADDGAERRA